MQTGERLGLNQSSNVDYNIYSKAISSSEPRVVQVEGNTNPQIIREKMIRRVEVPYTREVKVPTQSVHVVASTETRKIPVNKLVQVEVHRPTNEPYVEYDLRERIRPKEEYVKRIVPERIVTRVPVTKTRRVKVPTTEYVEIQTFETIQVPSTKQVTVDGFRVDTVTDTKVVEVEEFQNYLVPPGAFDPNDPNHPFNQTNQNNNPSNPNPNITGTRVLGRLPTHNPTSLLGTFDSNPYKPAQSFNNNNNNNYNPNNLNNYRSGVDNNNNPSGGDPSNKIRVGPLSLSPSLSPLGALILSNEGKDNRLRPGDVIIGAHNCPISAPQDFYKIFMKIPGNLLLQIQNNNNNQSTLFWNRN